MSRKYHLLDQGVYAVLVISPPPAIVLNALEKPSETDCDGRRDETRETAVEGRKQESPIGAEGGTY